MAEEHHGGLGDIDAVARHVGSLWACVTDARGVWIWQPLQRPWQPDGIQAGTPEAAQRLAEAGYAPIPDQTQDTLLTGQLADMVTLIWPADDGGQGGMRHEYWARRAALTHAQATPVVLGFAVPDDATAHISELEASNGSASLASLPVTAALPPPQLGECALVQHGSGWKAYTLGQVGDAGLALWDRMGKALRHLNAPASWWLYTPAYAWATDPEQYQALHNRLREQARTAGKRRERAAIAAQITNLTQVRTNAEQIRQANERAERDRDAWLAQWREVQRMAQELATLYWQAYQATAPDTATATATATVARTGDDGEGDGAAATAQPAAARRPRSPRAPRAGLVTKDSPAVHIPSHIFAQGIMRSLLNPGEYKQYPDRNIAEYHTTLAKRKGEITITLEPGDEEGWDHVLGSLNALGDEIADTFCAILAMAIDTHGKENITAPMWVNTDDILHICQRKQSNRAYTPEQRAAVVEHLRVIARAHVHASWPSGRKGHEYRISSAIWDVFGQAIGEYKTVTGEPVWERRQVKIGEWAKLLPPLSKETALLLRKVLEYHSQRDRYAKRLGRYLTLQFRVNMKAHGGTILRSMAVLLEQCGIKPDMKHPGETRKAIEDALARLKADGVIGAYRLVIDSTPKGQETQALIDQRARGWWEHYAGQLWQIEAPEHVLEQYRALPQPTAADDGDEGD